MSDKQLIQSQKKKVMEVSGREEDTGSKNNRYQVGVM